LLRTLKGKLVIGLAAVAVVAFAGGAYAATQTSGPNTRQAFMNDVAKRLHVTPQQLTAALNGEELDQLQAEVKAGRLTQSQANALGQRLKQNGAAPGLGLGFFGPGPGGAQGGGPGGGQGGGPGGGQGGGPGGGQGGGPGPGFGPPMRGFGGPLGFTRGFFGAAGGYLGLTDAQLLQQLHSGKSLADIATANGKSVSGLEQAMTATAKAELAKLLASKMITAAQEKQLLSGVPARIANEVNRKGFPAPRFGPGLRFHGTLPQPPKGSSSQLGPAAPLFAPAGPSA